MVLEEGWRRLISKAEQELGSKRCRYKHQAVRHAASARFPHHVVPEASSTDAKKMAGGNGNGRAELSLVERQVDSANAAAANSSQPRQRWCSR